METEIQPPQISSSNNKLFVIVVTSVLLTSIIVGLAVYLWQKSANEKAISSLEQKIFSLEEQISTMKEAEIEPQPISLPVLFPTPMTDPTTNWKTYINKTHTFQFKHPPYNLNVEDLGTRTIISFSQFDTDPFLYPLTINYDFTYDPTQLRLCSENPSWDEIILEGTNTDQYFPCFLEQSSNYQPQPIEKVSFNNFDGTSFYVTSNIDSIIRVIHIEHPRQLEITAPDRINKTFNQILSTFKFTN